MDTKGRKTMISLCQEHLFDDADKISHLAESIQEGLLTIRKAYTLWAEKPSMKSTDIAKFIIDDLGVHRNIAHKYVRIIQELLGDLNKASSDFHRFKFNELILAAYDKAETAGKYDAMVKAASAYAKYNNLDKEEPQKIPWEDIIPQTFVPTDDPSVLGINPIPNVMKKIEEMKKKYASDIEDISYEDIDIKELEDYE